MDFCPHCLLPTAPAPYHERGDCAAAIAAADPAILRAAALRLYEERVEVGELRAVIVDLKRLASHRERRFAAIGKQIKNVRKEAKAYKRTREWCVAHAMMLAAKRGVHLYLTDAETKALREIAIIGEVDHADRT